MAWIKIAVFVVLVAFGSILMADMLWGAYLAFALGSLFDLVHPQDLNLPVAAEMVGLFCLGLLTLVIGVRGVWRTVSRSNPELQ